MPDRDAVGTLYERHACDQQRAGYRRGELAQRLAAAPELRGDDYERVEAMLDAARLAPALERALADELPTAEKELFLLVAYDDLTVAQAARCLGLTPVAGRMRLGRARRKLRAALDAGADRELREHTNEAAIAITG